MGVLTTIPSMMSQRADHPSDLTPVSGFVSPLWLGQGGGGGAASVTQQSTSVDVSLSCFQCPLYNTVITLDSVSD